MLYIRPADVWPFSFHIACTSVPLYACFLNGPCQVLSSWSVSPVAQISSPLLNKRDVWLFWPVVVQIHTPNKQKREKHFQTIIEVILVDRSDFNGTWLSENMQIFLPVRPILKFFLRASIVIHSHGLYLKPRLLSVCATSANRSTNHTKPIKLHTLSFS